MLSHGQGAVERGFNLRDQSLKKNIRAESLNTHRIITDQLISCNVKHEKIDISNLCYLLNLQE